MAIVSAIHCG